MTKQSIKDSNKSLNKENKDNKDNKDNKENNNIDCHDLNSSEFKSRNDKVENGLPQRSKKDSTKKLDCHAKVLQ